MNTAKNLIDTLKKDIKRPKQKVNSTYIKLIEILPLQPITSKKQHEIALNVIEKLMSHSIENKTKDNGITIYLQTLAELVANYEKKQFKSSPISGSEMLAYIIKLKGLRQSDLSKELGGQSIVSKILSGERELNIRQIKALAKRFNISPEVFI